MKINDFYDLIDKFAPFEYSERLCKIEDCYDNSGIIVDLDEKVTGVTFALDLSRATVDEAISIGSNLIVTHHPAIYKGIERIDGALLFAAKNGIGVISAHLNLDCAKEGVDYCFAKALGAKKCDIVTDFGRGAGYGRVFSADTTVKEFARAASERLKTTCMIYGDENAKVKRVASFCGAGLSEKEIESVAADLYCSADVSHHVLKYALEKGSAVLVFSHYSSEKEGIINLYRHFCGMKQIIDNEIKLYFFDDERFA